MLKFSNDEDNKQQLRKNHIKISKNRLPSDFFGSVKPTLVSSSLPQRPKKLVPGHSPLESKNSPSKSEIGTANGETADE